MDNLDLITSLKYGHYLTSNLKTFEDYCKNIIEEEYYIPSKIELTPELLSTFVSYFERFSNTVIQEMKGQYRHFDLVTHLYVSHLKDEILRFYEYDLIPLIEDTDSDKSETLTEFYNILRLNRHTWPCTEVDNETRIKLLQNTILEDDS